VKTICDPTEVKNKRFAKQQEPCRKDVEWIFEILQTRWTIVRHQEVMTACVIMHKIIFEDEHDEELHDQGW
jgi:hypothetical protein